jgi:hypothetical protein
LFFENVLKKEKKYNRKSKGKSQKAKLKVQSANRKVQSAKIKDIFKIENSAKERNVDAGRRELEQKRCCKCFSI